MFSVNKEKCIGCSQCVKDCPVSTISLVDNKAEINNERCLKCGHCIAICPVEAVSTDDYNMEDVIPYDNDSFTVEADNLLNFIKFRRSVRRFKDKEVEQEKIEKIIEAGRFTQTGSNLQNVSYVVVKDKIQELRKIVLETLKSLGENLLNKETTPENIKRYCYMWIKMYNDFLEDPNGEDKLFFKAPALIIVKSESTVNASLAASNMELMTNALGLGTYFSGFLQRASEVNPKINEFLGLKENESLVNCMVIGYPKVKYKRTVPRKEAKITWM